MLQMRKLTKIERPVQVQPGKKWWQNPGTRICPRLFSWAPHISGLCWPVLCLSSFLSVAVAPSFLERHILKNRIRGSIPRDKGTAGLRALGQLSHPRPSPLPSLSPCLAPGLSQWYGQNTQVSPDTSSGPLKFLSPKSPK